MNVVISDESDIDNNEFVTLGLEGIDSTKPEELRRIAPQERRKILSVTNTDILLTISRTVLVGNMRERRVRLTKLRKKALRSELRH